MNNRAYDWYKQAGDEPLIIWNTRDPFAGRSPEQFEQEVKGMLTGRVEAAGCVAMYRAQPVMLEL